jgi:CelD/BcsL family acetyltransferase involved in cellulose biosynthesis
MTMAGGTVCARVQSDECVGEAHVVDAFKTEIVEDWNAFLALESEWNALLGASKSDIVFLTWEWVRSWLSVAGTSVRPIAVVVRNSQGELAGVAPFYISEYRLIRSIRYRVLRPMADYATGAECLDWIVRSGEENQVCRLIMRSLAAVSGKWDCIWMPYVPDWTGASTRITNACREQGFFCRTRVAEFGYSVLPSSFDGFLKGLSRNRRSELRRHQRAVLGEGQAIITRCLDEKDLHRYLDALFDLHHKRWMSRGEEGSFKRKPAEAAFYREFMPVAMRKGWLRFYGLSSAGEFKAVQVGYVYGGIFYQLQEGFDPEYVRGAGNVLRAKIIEDCIAAGLTCYDFLGEMSEHKRRWSADVRLGRHIFVGNRNVRSRMLFLKEIWPTGRYLRPSLLPTNSRRLS